MLHYSYSSVPVYYFNQWFEWFQISPDQAIKTDREEEAGEEEEEDVPDVMIEVPYEYEDYEVVEKEVRNSCSK